jgi:hypothetical protein
MTTLVMIGAVGWLTTSVMTTLVMIGAVGWLTTSVMTTLVMIGAVGWLTALVMTSSRRTERDIALFINALPSNPHYGRGIFCSSGCS